MSTTPSHNATVALEPAPIHWLAVIMNVISGTILMGLMAITFIDVLGRTFLNKPLTGSTELTQVTLCLIIFTALPVISWRNEHVVVDILDDYIPPKIHMIRTVIFHILGAIGLVFIGQRLMVLGERSLSHNEITDFLQIPVGIPIEFMGIMCWITAALMLTVGVYLTLKRYQQVMAKPKD